MFLMSISLLSFGFRELRLMYGVSTVPTIIVVKKDGVIVTEQGQKEIETNGINVLVMWTK